MDCMDLAGRKPSPIERAFQVRDEHRLRLLSAPERSRGADDILCRRFAGSRGSIGRMETIGNLPSFRGCAVFRISPFDRERD